MRQFRKRLTKGRYISLCRLINERDEFCIICRKKAHEHHHVIFRSAGGDDAENNLVLLCDECHKKYAHGEEQEKWRQEFLKYLNSDRIKQWRETNKLRIEKFEK